MRAEQIIRLLFRHAWLLFILVTCANAAGWWNRAKQNIALDPQLEAGYRCLIRGLLIYGNIPWLFMGVGIVFGGVPSVFHYFNPRNGPFVVAWYICVVALWLGTIYWLFFRRGAEQLIEYPGLLNLPTNKPWVVKAFFLLCLAGGVAGLSAMILGNIQVPNLR